MDKARRADYLRIANDLRAAGIATDLYVGNKNIGQQLKYADKLGIPLAIIAGSNEYDRGVVQIKDLVTVGELAETATLEEWKANEAQQEVALAEVVVTTCRLLSSAL